MIDIQYVLKHIAGKKRVNPPRRIVMGFVLIILCGAVLLMLPISSRGREFTDFMTTLFTATSATCVTGLNLVDTYSHWSLFGQVIILILIQIGGLGFMTILTIVFFLRNRQIGLRERMLMMQSFSLDSMEGVVRLVRHVLFATLVIEGTGAVVLALCFIPETGLWHGIWSGIFHSVSAFCNAGFDITGAIEPNSSLMRVNDNPVILLTISLLIIVGGLGFFVWEDVYTKRSFRKISIYSKLVLIVTPILIFIGFAGILLFEWNNPQTLQKMNGIDRFFNALFQSVTARTAGFASMDQGQLTEQSKFLTIILMMIGGSSGSTAGGVKTVTVAILFFSAANVLSAKRDTVIFKHRISHRLVISAAGLLLLAISIDLFGGLFISVVEGVSLMDAVYESSSAYATVGLSAGITPDLSVASKLLLIAYMFMGRVGIMTLSVTIMMRNKNRGKIRYPQSNIMIG